MNFGKTAKPIELPFGMVSRVGRRNRVLDGYAHWRHQANTDERLRYAAMRLHPRCATNDDYLHLLVSIAEINLVRIDAILFRLLMLL